MQQQKNTSKPFLFDFSRKCEISDEKKEGKNNSIIVGKFSPIFKKRGEKIHLVLLIPINMKYRKRLKTNKVKMEIRKKLQFVGRSFKRFQISDASFEQDLQLEVQ